MNRITKIIVTIAASIITMLYVLLTLAGFYVLACLAFKQSAYKVTRTWINIGHLPHKEKAHVKTHN